MYFTVNNKMKYVLVFLSLMVIFFIYFIPLIIIAILAYMCCYLGISDDLTSTKPVVWFITPIIYLEKQINKLKKQKNGLYN